MSTVFKLQTILPRNAEKRLRKAKEKQFFEEEMLRNDQEKKKCWEEIKEKKAKEKQFLEEMLRRDQKAREKNEVDTENFIAKT